MAIPNQTPYNNYVANGSTRSFAFEFLVIRAIDLKVFIDNVEQPVSAYSINGLGHIGGGDVIFVTAPIATAKVSIIRDIALSRDIDYQDNGDLLAETLNADFDYIWMAMQQNRASNELALTRPFNGMNYDATGLRIIKLAAPIDDNDAVNKIYLTSTLNPFIEQAKEQVQNATVQANNSAIEADRAKGEADRAELNANNSVSAALSASNEANRAATEADRAKESAESIDVTIFDERLQSVENCTNQNKTDISNRYTKDETNTLVNDVRDEISHGVNTNNLVVDTKATVNGRNVVTQIYGYTANEDGNIDINFLLPPLEFGAVGTDVFGYSTAVSGLLGTNRLVAGATITPIGIGTNTESGAILTFPGSVRPVGTWRCMGAGFYETSPKSPYSITRWAATLFRRIA